LGNYLNASTLRRSFGGHFAVRLCSPSKTRHWHWAKSKCQRYCWANRNRPKRLGRVRQERFSVETLRI